jgi:hypothetical protein
MAEPSSSNTSASARISLDAWAVIVALLAALLIRTGIVTRVPW